MLLKVQRAAAGSILTETGVQGEELVSNQQTDDQGFYICWSGTIYWSYSDAVLTLWNEGLLPNFMIQGQTFPVSS